MATFWESAAKSVDHIFCFYFDHYFDILVISHFGFDGGIWVLVAPVPGHDFLLRLQGYTLCSYVYSKT